MLYALSMVPELMMRRLDRGASLQPQLAKLCRERYRAMMTRVILYVFQPGIAWSSVVFDVCKIHRDVPITREMASEWMEAFEGCIEEAGIASALPSYVMPRMRAVLECMVECVSDPDHPREDSLEYVGALVDGMLSGTTTKIRDNRLIQMLREIRQYVDSIEP